MNRQIRQLGVALLVLFAVLFVQLNVVQVFRADSLTADPLNTRRVVRDFGQRRGQIITSDGVVVAIRLQRCRSRRTGVSQQTWAEHARWLRRRPTMTA